MATSPTRLRVDTLTPVLPEGGTVKVFGLGGVGGPLARYVALFLGAAGRPARLVLADGDTFEPANKGRMLFALPGNKAAVLRDELVERHSESRLSVLAVEEYVTPQNIQRLIRDGDQVFLAVDNHATRRLVSDHCGTLQDVVLISGGNDGVEKGADGRNRRGTYGNVQIYIRQGGQDLTPALTRYHPEIASPADKLPGDKSCSELVASVPQIVFTNLAAASAMLNAWFLHLSGCLHYSEWAFDIADGLGRPVPLPAPEAASRPDVEKGKTRRKKRRGAR